MMWVCVHAKPCEHVCVCVCRPKYVCMKDVGWQIWKQIKSLVLLLFSLAVGLGRTGPDIYLTLSLSLTRRMLEKSSLNFPTLLVPLLPSLPPSWSLSLSPVLSLFLLCLSLPSSLSFSPAHLPEWQLNTRLSQAYLASADGWLGSLFIRHDLGRW